eukprot:scaffold12257_cov141-Isochrysis_galbana.AAC.5
MAALIAVSSDQQHKTHVGPCDVHGHGGARWRSDRSSLVLIIGRHQDVKYKYTNYQGAIIRRRLPCIMYNTY